MANASGHVGEYIFVRRMRLFENFVTVVSGVDDA